jgi:hypothetical protein
MKQMHNNIAAAASSAVPGRVKGINGYAFGSAPPVLVGAFALGIPRVTFFPPISMATPFSLAAVKLFTI